MVIANKIKGLDPVTEADVEDSAGAPRLDTLNGKVIGLYSNQKLNADRLLDILSGVLDERFDVKEFVHGTYNGSRVMRSDEWKDVERCDAIILTHGD